MKQTSAAASRLRQSNPVPDDAFSGAARDGLGRVAFERIIASGAAPPPQLHLGRQLRVHSAAGPGRPGRRVALRFAVPAVATVAAGATAAAVALSGVSAPSRHTYT